MSSQKRLGVKVVPLFCLLCCSLFSVVGAQTIGEKRQGPLETMRERRVSKGLTRVNKSVAELRETLRELYAQIPELREQQAHDQEYAALAEEIREVQRELRRVEEEWQRSATQEERSSIYALWHQPWTTVEQLVMDYGSDDYIYFIPPDISTLRMSVASNLPVPRECWEDVLELILAQNGVAIRQLNPFLRELYLVAESPPQMSAITADRAELAIFRPNDRVCFVLSPPQANGQDAEALLKRFASPETTLIERVGQQIFVVGTTENLQELLKVYDFVVASTGPNEYQVVSLAKISAREMESLVRLYFGAECEQEHSALKVMAPNEPGHALFLAGPANLVRQAKKLVEGVEAQIANPREMVVYTYTARHSDVEELADVLDQVYSIMLTSPGGVGEAERLLAERADGATEERRPNPRRASAEGRGYSEYAESSSQGNFVVFPKTGTLIMVVEQDFLPQLKSLLRKLDVPKRMVRIDVLLFEKRVTDQSRFGLDLLRVGSSARGDADRTGLGYSSRKNSSKEAGIVEFVINRLKGKWLPAFDFAFDFLMAREDIRINATPSVTTINNTEAKIELVEEISIDNGAIYDSDAKNNLLRQSYTRTQYGTTIVITPTINAGDNGWAGEPEEITLDTCVLFETPRPSTDDRPPVIRRRITNKVRIENGRTVVLGFLRSKVCEDLESGFPFISEIPFFGKIFGSTKGADRDTEMFMFITPTIIDDPATEMNRVRAEMMCRRPGDLPEFLERVQYARDAEKRLTYERTLKALLSTQDSTSCWERAFR